MTRLRTTLLAFALFATLVGSLLGVATAQSAGSHQVSLPGSGSMPFWSTTTAAVSGDSAGVRASAGQSCPVGSFWAHAWGVATCLQAHQVCPADVLLWQAGDAICQALVPAGAAVRHVVSYSTQGGSVRETYTLQAADPLSIATRADISPSRGYATVACVAGTWTITASSCSP